MLLCHYGSDRLRLDVTNEHGKLQYGGLRYRSYYGMWTMYRFNEWR